VSLRRMLAESFISPTSLSRRSARSIGCRVFLRGLQRSTGAQVSAASRAPHRCFSLQCGLADSTSTAPKLTTSPHPPHAPSPSSSSCPTPASTSVSRRNACASHDDSHLRLTLSKRHRLAAPGFRFHRLLPSLPHPRPALSAVLVPTAPLFPRGLTVLDNSISASLRRWRRPPIRLSVQPRPPRTRSNTGRLVAATAAATLLSNTVIASTPSCA
jgi:hypothetical protein